MMRWSVGLLSLQILLSLALEANGFITPHRVRELREKTRNLFYHSWNSYLDLAFPSDEIRPISCEPLGPNYEDPRDFDRNDVLGNFSLTLVDSLDTFVVLGDYEGFERAVQLTIDFVNFDQDVKVQVFETTIRVMGGLLSAHLFATQPKYGFYLPWYQDELLFLAQDLADRLLPAFTSSVTGIPYARINLRRGLDALETIETCSAGAGSLLLEWGTLSRLSGNKIYEKLAKRAFFAVWNRKSDLGLVGNTINLQTGQWTFSGSGIGAGIDSFLEYMIKSYVLFGEDEYLRVWKEAYSSIMKYVRDSSGHWYRSVNMNTGAPTSYMTDSLSAFWAGVQVLAGDIEGAIKSHLFYANLWMRYRAIPEGFAPYMGVSNPHNYPLRPEFIESNYFLYRATNDPFYLRVAEMVFEDLSNRKVDCGVAGVADLNIGKLDDRMPSYFLAETLKYLYLTFDEANWINSDDSNMVFTTEGHLLPLPSEYLENHKFQPYSLVRSEMEDCPTHQPLNNPRYSHFLQPSVAYRNDGEYVRTMTGLKINEPNAIRTGLWSLDGVCIVPAEEDYIVDLLFANEFTPEDPAPGPNKVSITVQGLEIKNIQGLKFQVTRRIDDLGYYVSKVGPYSVSGSQKVFISDPVVLAQMLAQEEHLELGGYVNLKFLIPIDDPLHEESLEVTSKAVRAAFGPSSTLSIPPGFGVEGPIIPLSKIVGGDSYGCEAFKIPHNHIAWLRRGGCSFGRKMRIASESGAIGVVVVSDEDSLFIPSYDPVEHTDQAIPLLLIRNSTGEEVEKLFKLAGRNFEVHVQIVKEELKDRDVLINGYLLSNVELMQP